MAVFYALDVIVEDVVIEPIGITLQDDLIDGKDALFEGFRDGIPFLFHKQARDQLLFVCGVVHIKVFGQELVAFYVVFICHSNSFGGVLIGQQHYLCVGFGIKVLHDSIYMLWMKSFKAIIVKRENSEVMSHFVVYEPCIGIPDIEVQGAIAGGDGETHLFERVPEQIRDQTQVLGGVGYSKLLIVGFDVLMKLVPRFKLVAQGIGYNGFYMLILELYKVVVAIQGSIVGIGGFHIGNNAGTAIVVVGRQPGIHICGRSLGEVVVIVPERGGHYELRVKS
ncbi:MAG: hypothetical protein EOM68_23340 [Spirochaetia bacterium]|nr:hypothetical protein [Spirochaetia bacterium]